jgi:hypothetical protein
LKASKGAKYLCSTEMRKVERREKRGGEEGGGDGVLEV